MQIYEAEIVIPLKRRLDPKVWFIVSCTGLLLSIGQFIYWAIWEHGMAASAGDIESSIFAFVFMLVTWGVLLTLFFRQMRAPLPYIRINHEGIFTSEGSFLIRWTDIKELSPPTRQRSHFLRIVVRDIREVSARANIRSRTFLLAGIDERTLPISMDELLTTIQEHFATELREHSITIG